MYITQEHKDQLEKDLKELETKVKVEIADKIADSPTKNAAEDSQYAQILRERDRLTERVEDIEEMLKKAKIIDQAACNTKFVTLGAWVTIKINGREKEMRIVGAAESDPTNGTISNESPMGEALVGAKVSEKVYVMGPSGNEQEIEVLSIRCK